MVVHPIKPIILGRIHGLETFAGEFSGGCAALEVPDAARLSVLHDPAVGKLICGFRWNKGQRLFSDVGLKHAYRCLVRSDKNQNGAPREAVLNRPGREDGLDGPGLALAEDSDAEHQLVWRYSRLLRVDYNVCLFNFSLPILGVIFLDILRIGQKHEAIRPFRTPEAERQFVTVDEHELPSFEVPKDCLPRALLPDSAGLIITDEGVPIVDSGKPEMKSSTIHHPFPDESGMAERAVGSSDRNATNRIVHDVMVAHCADGIGVRLCSQSDR